MQQWMFYADGNINGSTLERVDTFKYLGITVNQNMTWSDHIESVVAKANQRIGLLKRVKHLLPRHARITLYNVLILPILGPISWSTGYSLS